MSYFVVGCDPTGTPRSNYGEDIYYGDHGRYVLQSAPGIAGKVPLNYKNKIKNGFINMALAESYDVIIFLTEVLDLRSAADEDSIF